MMTGAMLRAWKTVKQHVPLIKFKKGGPFRENTPSAGSSPVQTASGATRPVVSKGQQAPLIEDWELPPNYRRTPLEDKEIDAINSGGAY